MPWYVTWVVPSSARTKVAKVPLAFGPGVTTPPAATVNAGHAWRQPPVHVEVVALSPWWTYRAWPVGPVRIGPKAVVITTVTVPGACDAPAAVSAGPVSYTHLTLPTKR